MTFKHTHGLKLEYHSIEIANYSLKPLNPLNAKARSLAAKEGFLLKVDFKNFGIGYADCFSWEELGDIPLNEQMKNLKEGIYHTHLEKSLYFARVDAEYRSKNQNIFKNIELPKNHYTCVNHEELNYGFLDLLQAKGFSLIKLKCGISLQDEIFLIKKIAPYLKKLNMLLRLDFNTTLDLEGIFYFLSSLKRYLNVINFVEDPILYNENSWEKIKLLYPKIRLAMDRMQHHFFHCEKKNEIESYDFLIIKPAVQNVNQLLHLNPSLKSVPFVFTSYMDHPLGQLSALYESSLFYCKNSLSMQYCGFLTHTLYEKNAYSEELSIFETKLIPPLEGNGFGFDALLQKERWRKLV